MSKQIKMVKVTRIKDGKSKKEKLITKEELLNFSEIDEKDVNESLKKKVPVNPETYVKFDLSKLPEKESYTIEDLEKTLVVEETKPETKGDSKETKNDKTEATGIVDPIRTVMNTLKDRDLTKKIIDLNLEKVKATLENDVYDDGEKTYAILTGISISIIKTTVLNYDDALFNTLNTNNEKHIVSILKRLYDPELSIEVFNKNKDACMKIYKNIIKSKDDLLVNLYKRIDKFMKSIIEYLDDEYLTELREYIEIKLYGVEVHEYLRGKDGINRYPYLESIINDILDKVGNCELYLKNPNFMDRLPSEYLGFKDVYYDKTYNIFYGTIFCIIASNIEKVTINKSERLIKDALIRLEVMESDEDYEESLEEVENKEKEIEESENKESDNKKEEEKKPLFELTEEDEKLFELINK